MDYYKLDDTIVAISTSLGKSGIGIVRMSGAGVLKIVDQIFSSKKGESSLSFQSHTIHYGFITEDIDVVDEVLLSVMRAPRTYTKQDIVEINCHGGIVALRKVLNLCVQKGARLANPGEFTLRAYLNGRIDLTQAEAVLNIIDAKTEESLKVASRQLSGGLSDVLNGLREKLIEIISEFEAVLDFPEEEIELSRKKIILNKLKNISDELKNLLKHSKEGRLMQEGIKGVIAGRPNVGKSSLMNALLGHDRVIVTSTPGTTRDVVEEVIDLGGIPLRIADTAGIIETKDLIEQEGVMRAKKEIEIADIVIVVLDASSSLNKDDEFLFQQVKNKEHIVCINKIDLGINLNFKDIKKYGVKNPVQTSAIKRLGVEELKEKIYNLFMDEKIDLSTPIVTNLRHQEAASNASVALDAAVKNLTQSLYLELVTQDVKTALVEISKILGKEVTEDIINSIFSRFCIGK
ncbi:MAG: tRNA uridine-5-carboxymethylaminomethyl(34) synthesis GTPase MnmE [Candidatus Saelkia tenebricola]|nr:tRNA uridine-5-carboxymethylaminomethyl(34) synthesis GTPase MnmE [Candidatus Saelkia tenebricola]